MTWVTGLAVYAVTWWLVIFMVLPWGNRPIDAEDIAKGHAPSAPKKPHMLVKAGATTVISGIIWAVVYVVMETGWIGFR
ncbi:MAG: DUF1467 family protein [Rhodospirillales bacterium]|jgi:predicted secreted protein|nr:DUF1467 family protein [Rhodospirillales bacterium]